MSLVAFGVALLRLPKARTPDRARDIGVSIAAYLTSNHMDWFTNNGGWVRMCVCGLLSPVLFVSAIVLSVSCVCSLERICPPVRSKENTRFAFSDSRA